MRRRLRSNSTETTVIPESQFGDHQSFFGGSISVGNTASQTTGLVGGAQGVRPGAQGQGQVPGAAAEPETIVLRVRRHGRHLTLPVIALLVIAGASGYFIGWFPESWMNIAAATTGAVLGFFLGLVPLFAWLAHRTVVTTRRVILHRGFIVRHRSEVSLARVREVKSRQNIVQRMYGSGDVVLYVGAESTTISDAPGVKLLHASLQELSESSYDAQVRAEGRFGI